MRIALLTAPMFEDVELWYPYYRLLEEGHHVDLVGCERGATIDGKRGTSATTTASAHEISFEDYNAVVVPGGFSPDHMRRCDPMVGMVRSMGEAGKLVAAICHGPWMLASTGLTDGRRLTSFHSIRDDMVNGGAEWVDEEVVTDGNVITSRGPQDLPAFMRAVTERLQSLMSVA